ncbi:MAG TPA: imidazole glycerol phosphate synthase subunit HisH, partial [Mycobacteriales bacterium]|nr:imidazole glycerol phosphate synthase subunit HisH [Mycobacteriales bacterium]
MKVVVLDHGSGNLRSAERALARAGADVTVTADLAAAAEADGLVVPGVGAYAACMAGIDELGAGPVIRARVDAGRPV